MSPRSKLVLVVLAGWIVPFACILLDGRVGALGFAAVAIAWWHGYVAARLEAKTHLPVSANTSAQTGQV